MTVHQSASVHHVTDPMENACSRFKDFLRLKGKQPSFTTLEALQLQVRQLEFKQRGSSTTLKIGRSVDPILKFLRTHSDAFDTMVQANPYPAALVWGTFKILLNVAWYHFHYFENLMKMLEEIGEGLPIYREYEAILDLVPESRKTLADVYYDILVFLYQAYKVYKKRRSLMLCHNLWKTFQADFGDTTSKFDHHKQILQKYVELTTAMRVKDIHSGVREVQAGVKKVEEGMKRVEAVIQNNQSKVNVDIQILSQSKIQPASLDQRKSIMKWISSSDPQMDSARASRGRVEASGQWLLGQNNEHSAIFKSWLDSTDKKILRIVGRPGSGKTVLSTAIIEHLQQQHAYRETAKPSTAVCTTYFFCSKSNQGQDFQSVLAGLMKQILVQLPELPQCVVDCFQISSGNNRNTLTIADSPEKLFEEISHLFKKLYLVIDGLDELSEPGEAVKQLLQHTNHLPNVRTVLLSRDISTINCRLLSYPVIKLDGRNTGQDIDRYLNEQLDDLRLEDEEVEISPEVRDMLSKKADGMFLWVKYMMSSLRSATSLEGIVEKISEMPKDLDEFYDSILLKLARTSEELHGLAKRVIMLMCAASRPLKWEELACMLSTDGNEEEGKIIKYKSRILTACSPLIENSTETNEFRFAHASVMEYFLNPKSKRSQALQLGFAFREIDAQTEIAFVCLNYLLGLDPRSQNEEAKAKQPFLEYAETFWGYHIIRSEYSDELSGKMRDYLSIKPRRSKWMARQLFRESSGFPLQHLIATQKQLHRWDVGLKSASSKDRLDWIQDVAQILVDIDTSENGQHTTAPSDNNASAPGRLRITYFEKLMVIRDLSREYTIRQRLGEGEQWMTEALTRKQAEFGEEHISTVWLLNSLGIIYDQQHRVTLSAQTHERALRIQEKNLGPMHLETVWTVNELGRVYRHLKRYDDAIAMHERAYEALKAQLPGDELQIAWTLNTLARAYRKNGSTTKALECHEEATDIQRRLLGEDHPHFLWSIADMGRCHRDKGELSESISYHRRCLEGRKRVLGLDHADTLWAMNDLGLVLSECGKLHEANQLHQQAVEGQIKLLGESHPHTLWSQDQIRKLQF
ncbi:hypothetical protein Dda_7354 [Drechslerella dactyloides]|uniref:NACHT domain-containing protein n=1 Tax=Drechslerella dactyloides TaxID=74499 RepID=A0AAD6IT88_DREDA|nr:hypothetical protein Dda_7354 [Drechslerella dactyloides]